MSGSKRCGHPLRIGRSVAAGMFERVREHGNKLVVVDRFRGGIGGDRLAGEEGRVRAGRAPRSAVPQRPPAPSKVLAQMPTFPGPRETLGISRTIVQTSLSAKKSWWLNLKPSRTPSTSKKKGSLRQPAKRRDSLIVMRGVWPKETGAASMSTSPCCPTPAAAAPRTQRSVAVCVPPSRPWKTAAGRRCRRQNHRRCRS